MALTEDLSIFFEDFGVSCTAGAITALGILDMPTQVVAGDMVLSTDYTLTARAADFGGLLYGDAIAVDGINYAVREVRRLDDGGLVEVALQKLAPDTPAPGSNPAEFTLSLDDLADVELVDPVAGESLTYDGTKWTDGVPPAGNLDGGTFN